VGIVIKTGNARGMEKALHMTLELAGQKIQESPGDEWYNTSPCWIEHWYTEIMKLAESAR
jgi:hypothetical protein